MLGKASTEDYECRYHKLPPDTLGREPQRESKTRTTAEDTSPADLRRKSERIARNRNHLIVTEIGTWQAKRQQTAGAVQVLFPRGFPVRRPDRIPYRPMAC